MINNTYSNDLEKWVLGEIKDKLEDYKDQELNACDLALILFESENVNGSYDCNQWDAIGWIKEYFDELGDEVKLYKEECGEMLNPFDDPEKFQVIITTNVADRLCSSNSYITEHWDETITLDGETIKAINKDWENDRR